MKKSGSLKNGLLRILTILLVLLFSFSITENFLWAEDGLFSDVDNLSNTDIQIQMGKSDPWVVRTRFVKVNFDQLYGDRFPEGADSILLNLLDDLSLITMKDRLERRSEGYYTWFGNIVGVLMGQAILVVEGDVLVGNITVNGQLYQVRPVGGGIHIIQEIDQSAFPEEASPIPVFSSPDVSETSSPPSSLDDGSIIDVLVVYTSAAASVSPSITAEIQLAIDETNQSYINSSINQRVRLAYSAQINYTESGNSLTDLERLQNPSDGYMDDVHTLRNQYCADIVTLWVETLDACGRGYLMTTVSNSFASYAFLVVKRPGCATGYYSFGHEMGHNMGAHHDRYVEPDPGAYDYSHGYVYTPNRWRTIMAYNNECSDQGFYCTRIQYWSNPNVNYGGIPTGVSESSPNSANNKLTLDNTAYTVANFRQYCVSGNPDFVVTSITLNPSSPTANGTFNADVTVKNQGAASGDGGWLDVWVNQSSSQSCGAMGDKRTAVGILSAGESKTFTLTGLSAGSAGSKTFRAFVDSACTTAETDENNNQTTKNYTVADCTCDLFEISPSSQRFSSQAGTGSVAITTRTCVCWTATSNVSWITITSGTNGCSDGTVNYSVATNTGSQRTETITISAPGCPTKTFTVTQLGINMPDFVVTSITLNPTSPRANTRFTAKVTVKNQGSVSGDAGWLNVWVNQPLEQSCPSNGDKRRKVWKLSPGTSKTFPLIGLSAGSAGVKTFRAFVDSNCYATESNEDNNQATISFTVF